MKNLFCIALLFCSSIVRSQDTTVVVSMSSLNFLFHSVPNLVKIGFAEMDEPYYLVCTCDKITDIDTEGNPLSLHEYLVTPSYHANTYITVYRLVGNDTIRISEVEFYNIQLPDPELHFGVARSGEFCSFQETRLFLRQNIYTLDGDYHFKILSWKVKIGKKEYTGMGSVLDSQVQKRIKKLKENAKIEIEVQCIADDNRERTVRAFFLRGPHKEPDWNGVPITDENGDFIYEENQK